MALIWEAYCKDCGKLLHRSYNGAVVEAVGKKHVDDRGHNVIIGYVPELALEG